MSQPLSNRKFFLMLACIVAAMVAGTVLMNAQTGFTIANQKPIAPGSPSQITVTAPDGRAAVARFGPGFSVSPIPGTSFYMLQFSGASEVKNVFPPKAFAAGKTSLNFSGPIVPGSLEVFLDGIHVYETEDYTVDSPTKITFTLYWGDLTGDTKVSVNYRPQ